MRYHFSCLGFVVTILSPAIGSASYAFEPLKTTVASSDLIVVGTLTAVRALPARGGIVEHEGTITVETRLAGDPVRGARCTLTWSRGRIPSGGIDHAARQGQRGIWLLHRASKASKGRYRADYPARFQTIAARPQIEALIRSPLFLVETKGWTDGGKACCIRFQIRTFLPKLQVRDFLAVERGRLRLHGRARLYVQGQAGDAIAARQGRWARATGRSVRVTRDRPYVVEVDLRRYFALQGRKGKPGREIFHVHWGTGPQDRSPSYSFGLD